MTAWQAAAAEALHHRTIASATEPRDVPHLFAVDADELDSTIRALTNQMPNLPVSSAKHVADVILEAGMLDHHHRRVSC